MGITGSPAPHQHRYAFHVLFDDFERAEFTKCGPIGDDFAAIEIREGGTRMPKVELGMATPKPITMERGVTDSLDVYNLLVRARDGSDGHQFTFSVKELNRNGSTKRRWTIPNAVPTEIQMGDWDNDANEVTIEKIVVSHEGATLG